ncbi:MAG: hypothetical protein QOG31_707 [Thermoplasmata archaeon]|jgi:hypothetical protein|nr:hypothetical protein [Thermoplasmata archaeon]
MHKTLKMSLAGLLLTASALLLAPAASADECVTPGSDCIGNGSYSQGACLVDYYSGRLVPGVITLLLVCQPLGTGDYCAFYINSAYAHDNYACVDPTGRGGGNNCLVGFTTRGGAPWTYLVCR